VQVAYFTMEVALDAALPTYSGGLGVLAGDFLRSAADLHLPLVGLTLRYRDGYFCQQIDADGDQREVPVSWDPGDLLERLEPTVTVDVGSRAVTVAAWRLVLTGVSGGSVTVLFLDTDLAQNAAGDRAITDQLYGGDSEHRLRQETVLGIGGVAMLEALGYTGLITFHMNEGHASLLTLRLLEAATGDAAAAAATSAGASASAATATATAATAEQVEAVRARCVFTTHTPVPAGHDRFAADLVREVLGGKRAGELASLGLLADDELNMTTLGTALSGYVNGVSRRHAEVTRAMMPDVVVASITNGVHHVYWTAPPMRAVFDRHLPGWRADSSMLRYAGDIGLEVIGAAHARSKEALLELVSRHAGVDLDASALTIGLARRVTPYKRTTLLFSDPERLAAIAEKHGRLQVVCSGKAHPRDAAGKEAIAALVSAGQRFGKSVSVVFLENYDLALAAVMCAGCDVWLNNPLRPLEASGTSGMKAAMNGVPSLSILDGWWLEGWVEGVTGWAIGVDDGVVEPGAVPEELAEADDDAVALYDKLDEVVAPVFFGGGEGFLRVRRSAIALNGSFFSTDRMAREYARAAYHLPSVL
jgi:starch phosphorylase